MAEILVTDDEPSDRLMIHTVLEAAGHRLIFAADGTKALERYASDDIDVVITDLVMPNLNGFRLIRELKKQDSKACIVAVTGKSPEHLHLAKEYGALMTLTKPVDADELLEAVEQAARTRKQLTGT